MKIIIVLTTLFVAVAFIPVLATIINVPDDYQTIQEGIDASSDGDTVLVQPGTYVENINFNGYNITLGSLFLTTGDTPYISSTIIDGDSSGSVVTFENDEDSTTVITGFTITNGYAEYGGGIYCVTNSRPIITYNVISRNWAYGEPWSIGYGAGIFCMDSGPYIRNNTVSQNLANWGGGICFWGTTYPVIKNCIFWADSAVMDCNEVFMEDVAWPRFTYCDIEDTIWSGEGNISCDPLFCPSDIGDFYLAENSCCAGAGEDGVNIGAFGVGCPSIISCDYTPGDINGDGNVNGNDITYAIRYFKGLGPPPPDSCWNNFDSSWLYSAGDVNGNCAFTGSDVTFLVSYYEQQNPEILWCPWTPPANPPVQMRKEENSEPVIIHK
jgi:hypothetical protein